MPYAAPMSGYRRLKVWQLASKIALHVHLLTRDERCRDAPHLVYQVRKSTASVPDNIAEGKESGSDPQFRRFLNIAKGSAGEAESQLMQLRQLDLVDVRKATFLTEKLAEVQRMIISLQRRLE